MTICNSFEKIVRRKALDATSDTRKETEQTSEEASAATVKLKFCVNKKVKIYSKHTQAVFEIEKLAPSDHYVLHVVTQTKKLRIKVDFVWHEAGKRVTAKLK